MTNTPQRFDHTDDGFETANDGDFVSYDDYAYWRDRSKVREAELDATLARVEELEKVCAEWVEVSQSNYQRAKRAEARVKELEAEREEDHKNINIKADFIEKMIGQSSDDHFELKRLRELLSDDLYDSKDWRSADLEGRITWLITMLANKNEEIDIWVKMINDLPPPPKGGE
jgi:ATPase subunit of ABC transporter with duplicated ATPase domains